MPTMMAITFFFTPEQYLHYTARIAELEEELDRTSWKSETFPVSPLTTLNACFSQKIFNYVENLVVFSYLR